MTKLFSLKSLAFAGAAAFALTLAAAPQADAAEAEEDICIQQADAMTASVLVSKSAVNVTDGKLEYYYATAKSSSSDVPTKWNIASVDDRGYFNFGDDDDSYRIVIPVVELTKAKGVKLYISAKEDGSLKTGPIVCKDAPKIKAETMILTGTGPSISLKDGQRNAITTGEFYLSSQYGDFEGSMGSPFSASDLQDGNGDLVSILQNAADLGGRTFILKYVSEDAMVPWTTAKLKVAATPKAPKIGLKIAKTFSLKFKKDTEKFRSFAATASDIGVDWNTGTGDSLTMLGVFGADHVEGTVLDDEFILKDNMKLQAKTVDTKKKKVDSRITTVPVYASAATPTAVNAVITQSVARGSTTTSITFSKTDLATTQESVVSSSAVVTIQYKTDDSRSKWTDVTNTRPVKFTANKLPDKLYVRVKGVDAVAAKPAQNKLAAYYEAPGRIMTITFDKNNPANDSTYNYDGTPVTQGAIATK